MKLLSTILHPTDFSDSSNAALETALTLAQEHGARLILLHVQEPPEVVEGEFGMILPEPGPEDEEIVSAMRGLLPPDLSIRMDYRVAYGNVVEEILQSAQATECDLIVLAKHGRRNFFTRWFHTNVAEQVIEAAPCEVMAVGRPTYENAQPA